MRSSADQHGLLYERCDIMDFLRKYVLMISAAAILCALIRGISSGWKGQERLMQIMCGIFLLATACGPLGVFTIPKLTVGGTEYEAEAQQIVQEAQEDLKAQQAAIIISRTCTYIEDKAVQLGLDMDITVTLNDELLPWEVSLRGVSSAYARTRLSDIIAQDLNIPEERQVWSQ